MTNVCSVNVGTKIENHQHGAETPINLNRVLNMSQGTRPMARFMLTFRIHFLLLSSEKLARKSESSMVNPASIYAWWRFRVASRPLSGKEFSTSLMLDGGDEYMAKYIDKCAFWGEIEKHKTVYRLMFIYCAPPPPPQLASNNAGTKKELRERSYLRGNWVSILYIAELGKVEIEPRLK